MKVQILSRLDPNKGVKIATGMKLLEQPRKGQHDFRKDWLQQHRQFITQTDAAITLHTVDGDVKFNIDYSPGRWCLTTGAKLPDAGADPHAEQCRAHVEKLDNPVKTDRWPNGYLVCPPNVFMTTMEAK